MGKGKRLKANRKRKGSDFQEHAQEVLTRNFQKEIRNSEMWPQMVAEFGEEKAEALLKQCKGELRPACLGAGRPGFMPDETGNDPENI
jgi:hypothetical protein